MALLARLMNRQTLENWLRQHHDAPLETVSRLRGGTSSKLFRLEFRDEKRAVLRVYDNASWLAQEPQIPFLEMAALEDAEEIGVGAPEFLALETRDVGLGGPMILMSFCEGETQICPQNWAVYVAELARVLAKIHAHQPRFCRENWRSWVEERNLKTPNWARNPEIWHVAFERYAKGAPKFQPTFLHRDFHPMNTLWRGEKLVSVVDWPNACFGPRGADIGHCRVNLAQMKGVEVADEFLREYENQTGENYDSFWDIEAVFSMALPNCAVYAPWREFGYADLTEETVRNRTEKLLENAVNRAGQGC